MTENDFLNFEDFVKKSIQNLSGLSNSSDLKERFRIIWPKVVYQRK